MIMFIQFLHFIQTNVLENSHQMTQKAQSYTFLLNIFSKNDHPNFIGCLK